MSQLDEPNVTFPLANSYNERFTTGFTSVATSALDQRKINCQYDVVNNAATGKQTLYLTKRPGVTVFATSLDSGVATTDQPYLAISIPAASAVSVPWVFVFDDTNTKVASFAATTTISTDGGYPKHVDKTVISGTENVVLQTSGSSGGRIFYASAINSWNEITDTDITAVSRVGKMEHVDGFAFIAGGDGYIYNSDLNSLSSWTAGNRIRKQIRQDFPLGLVKHGQLLLAFGSDSVEGYVNAGNATGSPLRRVPQISDTRIGIQTGLGLLTRHYYAHLDSFTYFVGVQAADLGRGVFAFNGERFEKVSTPFVDKILVERGFSNIGVISYFGKSAIAISLSNGIAAGTHRWLMFFPDVKEWFEWTSSVYQPVNSGTFFIGLPSTSARSIYSFASSNTWQDGSTAYTMQTQFKLPGRGPSRKFMQWAGVIADKAASTSNLSVEFSDDDYASWSTARDIDLSTQKKNIYRCGSYQDRAVRLSHSANLDCRIESFAAKVS